MAEEKLKQLQELAEKSDSSQPSTSSSPSRACTKSSWQQISTLMVYTAAGVKANDKVRASFASWLSDCVDFKCRSSLHLSSIISVYAFVCTVLLWLRTGSSRPETVEQEEEEIEEVLMDYMQYLFICSLLYKSYVYSVFFPESVKIG